VRAWPQNRCRNRGGTAACRAFRIIGITVF